MSIKATLAQITAAPVMVDVPLFGTLMVKPLDLEEESTLEHIRDVEKNPGRAMTMMVWFILRKNDPQLTYDDVKNMNTGREEVRLLIQKISEAIMSFRQGTGKGNSEDNDEFFPRLG